MITLRIDSSLPKISMEGNVLVHRIGISIKNANYNQMSRFPLWLNVILFPFLSPLIALILHSKNKYSAIWGISTPIPNGIFNIFHPHIPTILTLQDGDSLETVEKKMKPVWFFFKRGFKKAKIVHAISTFLGQWSRRMGFDGKLEIIPNGVDIKTFSRIFSEDVKYQLRKQLNLEPLDIVLITTSRLVYKNAVDEVIKSLLYLPANVKFLILGTGVEKMYLEKLCTKLNIESRVTFVGFVKYEDIPKYLSISNIFIRPSRTEGLGNSFIEAMVYGIPVIGTQEGGLADFLFDEEHNPELLPTGWIVSKNNPEQIAQKVNLILSDDKKTDTIVKYSRNIAIQKYNWGLIANEIYNKLFKSII